MSIVFCLPNVVDLEGVWKKYLPSDKIHLGLDLKGGMHLLLELDTAKLMDNIVDRKMNALKDAMITDGVRFLGIDRKGSSYPGFHTARSEGKTIQRRREQSFPISRREHRGPKGTL